MEKCEFIERTGFEPMDEEYKEIENMYYAFKGDKDQFCKDFVENGGPQRCQCLRVGKIRRLEGELEEKEKCFKNLEASLRKNIQVLQEQLDKELEWKPCSSGAGTNMKQNWYEDLLKYCDEFGDILSEDGAKEFIHREFGFVPDKVTIIETVETYEVNKHQHLRVANSFKRKALYVSSDWNYVRFNCTGYCYECVNGSLRFYHC